MSEDTTERLNNDGGSFETRVLTALAAINSRLDSMDSRLTALERKVDALEEKVDARLRETRPIWEAVLERLKVMDAKFDVFAHDMLEMRAEIVLLKKHLPAA